MGFVDKINYLYMSCFGNKNIETIRQEVKNVMPQNTTKLQCVEKMFAVL